MCTGTGTGVLTGTGMGVVTAGKLWIAVLIARADLVLSALRRSAVWKSFWTFEFLRFYM